MPRPRPTNLSRPAILALAMLVWFALPIGQRSARAAGCHLPDRPVLGMDSSGQSARHIAAWAMLDAGEAAPPVLRRVPCPGETPRTTVIPMVAAGAACLIDVVRPTDGASCPFVAFEDVKRLDPHPFRLDRPPR